MKYKLIVSDMDGTLLGDNHKITEENKIALSKALEKGVKIVPASGRIYNSAREHFDFLDINTPLIACNGAIIKETKTNKLIYKNNIPNDICLKIIDIFEKNEVYYQLYSENTMMCKNLSKEDQRKTKERLKNFFNDDINVHFGDDLKEEVVKHKILKIIAIDDYDMDKLKKVSTENPDQVTEIYNSVSDYLVTSVDFTSMIEQLMNYGFSEDQMYTVPGKTVEGKPIDGKRYEEYHVDEDAMEELIMKVFYTPVQ